MSLGQKIGASIKATRKARGMTQEQLGSAVGKMPGTISDYERGRIFPHYQTLYAIAEVLGVEAGDFLPVSGIKDAEAAVLQAQALATLRQFDKANLKRAVALLEALEK